MDETLIGNSLLRFGRSSIKLFGNCRRPHNKSFEIFLSAVIPLAMFTAERLLGCGIKAHDVNGIMEVFGLLAFASSK